MHSGQLGATRSRSKLLRRLRNLRNLEWFNVPFLISILSTTWPHRSIESVWQRLVAYLIVALLLVIGGLYWHLKLRQIRSGRAIHAQLAWLSRFQWIALVALVAATIALTASWIGHVGSTADRWWAVAFLFFGWAEYVNYFHVQLMHDTRADLGRLRRTRRLRRSWLATDLSNFRAR